MSKISTTITTKYQLEVSAAADMFIVPNPTFMLKELNNISTMAKIGKFGDDNRSDNEPYVTPSSMICQVWLTSPDLHSENIADHGIRIDLDEDDIKSITASIKNSGLILLDNKHIFCSYTSFMGFMPISLIKDMKENDVKKFVYNISIPADCNNEVDIKLNLNITAKQLAYRYSQFGEFEDVINRLYY